MRRQTPAAKRRVGPPHSDPALAAAATRDYELLMTFPAKSACAAPDGSACLAWGCCCGIHWASVYIRVACSPPFPPSYTHVHTPRINSPIDLESMMDMTLAEAGIDGVTLLMRLQDG